MKKSALFAALSAGAIAGTGAGLILGVPGLTSAAGDLNNDASSDVVVESINDGDHGEGRHGGPRGGGRLASPETLAGVLGLDAETLRSEFAAGKSIADVAGEQGVAIETVIDALVADVETHLAEHVADGSLTEEEAADKLANAETIISEKVNEVPPLGGRGPGFRSGAQLSATVLEMLGVDAATLQEAFAAGQSVADVAAENGVDLNDIVSTLVDEKEAHLAEHVADGSLTEEEAADKLANAETMITERLNTVPTPGDMGPRGPMRGGDGHGGPRGGRHDHTDGDHIDGMNDGTMDDGAATSGTGFDNLLNSDA